MNLKSILIKLKIIQIQNLILKKILFTNQDKIEKLKKDEK
jgi:hypothetical protein